MKNLSKKKKILLCVALMLFMGGYIFMQKTGNKQAEGVVAKVIIKPEGTTGKTDTEEDISVANPYKTFKVNGEMPEEYIRVADEFLKDDLQATEIYVMGITGTYEDMTVYYCTLGTENNHEYLEVLPQGASWVKEGAPSLNTGTTLEELEKHLGVESEDSNENQ